MILADDNVMRLVATALTICVAMATATFAQEKAKSSSATSQENRTEVKAQAQPAVEKQRQQAEETAANSIDKDAASAIVATVEAVKAIQAGQTDAAIKHLEAATGKVNVLVAREPATALLPVNFKVEVIDLAPLSVAAIEATAAAAEEAMDDSDYPQARLLLENLASEIHVRTYHLPLATYPIAVQEAARLLTENKTQQAAAILATALNTLVVIDRAIPLPLTVAQVAIDDAQEMAKHDRDQALALLNLAKHELERGKALGYAGDDPEYEALDESIANLETQIKGNEDSDSAFARLKDRIASFFKRQSESEKKPESASGQGRQVTAASK